LLDAKYSQIALDSGAERINQLMRFHKVKASTHKVVKVSLTLQYSQLTLSRLVTADGDLADRLLDWCTGSIISFAFCVQLKTPFIVTHLDIQALSTSLPTRQDFS